MPEKIPHLGKAAHNQEIESGQPPQRRLSSTGFIPHATRAQVKHCTVSRLEGNHKRDEHRMVRAVKRDVHIHIFPH
jgi:hypothetical protein